MTKHEDNEDIKKYKKRRLRMRIFLLVLFLVGVYLYGRYVGTTGLIINEIKIADNEIPESFNGLKIIHFSDLHFGRGVNKEDLTRIVNKINKIGPDIVVFTGDLIDRDTILSSDTVNFITSELKRIDTTVGKYAVTGNHDYNNKFYNIILSDSNFNLLTNNYDIVYYKGKTPIFLGGLGEYGHNKADIESTMSYYKSNGDLYSIILMHEPDYISKMKTYNADLVLAGHSHNGQVRIPFIGKVVTPKGSWNYYLPHYKVNDTELYISSGIGCSGMTIRLFDRPSINFYRLSNK